MITCKCPANAAITTIPAVSCSETFGQIQKNRLLPCPGYYKQCCDEHWGTYVSFPSGFLSVYAQQWDFWMIRQFYFQIEIRIPEVLTCILYKCMPVKVQLLELDTGQNLERISQSYILLPCLFNFLQGTS